MQDVYWGQIHDEERFYTVMTDVDSLHCCVVTRVTSPLIVTC